MACLESSHGRLRGSWKSTVLPPVPEQAEVNAPAPRGPLSVCVHDMAGRGLELPNLDPGTTVAQVKGLVCQRWQIPLRCQRLLLGTTVLEDSLKLSEQLPEGGASWKGASLSLAMVVTLEAVRRDLESPDVHTKVAALRAISSMRGLRGDGCAVASASACLKDPNKFVRTAAVEAVAAVAVRGDEATINAAGALLRDPAGFVREAAVRLLGSVAERGDERALAVALANVGSEDAEVRKAAVQALAVVAAPGEGRAAEAACRSLGDEDVLVRKAARLALQAIVEPGELGPCVTEDELTSVCSRLDHWDPGVRTAASLKLKLIAENLSCRCDGWGVDSDGSRSPDSPFSILPPAPRARGG